MSRTCHSCRAPMATEARFCGACGAPTRDHVRTVVQRGQQERQRVLRAALALGCACTGTLLGLLGGAALFGFHDADGWAVHLVGAAAVFLAAAGAALVQGDFVATFGGGTRVGWLAAAVPVAALSFFVALVFVRLLGDPGGDARSVSGPALFGLIVLAPLGEEWLCRGAAWRAAVTLAQPHTALLLTAILFAFLHGLGGGYLLELPHRFVAGLLFGWLRLRSGSLLPGIVAHALHNTGAWLITAT